MTIDQLIKRTDSIKQKKIEEGSAANFIGNVANKIFKGQSFAQSNQIRAQKALDKQAKKDEYASKSLDQGIQIAGFLDKSNIKAGEVAVSTIGKSADEVMKELSEFPQLYQEIASDEKYKNQDTSSLKTVAKVLNNAVKDKNSVGGVINKLIFDNKSIYDKTYKSKGLKEFLSDYKAGKIKTDAQIDQEQKEQSQKAAETIKTVVPQIISKMITSGIPAEDILAIAGGQ